MIKGVVFDCFGVLYHDGFKEFLSRYGDRLPEEQEYYYQLIRAYDAGFLSERDFYAELSRASGEAPADIRGLLKNVLTLNNALVPLLAQLKAWYRIGLLTNAERTSLQPYLDHEHVGQYFDVVLASSEVGAVKPQPIIYERMADRMGLMMSEMVFIDDSPGHVSAAETLGMHGHVYTSVPTLRRYLDRILAARF